MRTLMSFRPRDLLTLTLLVVFRFDTRAEPAVSSLAALQEFENALGRLANERHLSGLSAAIVQNHRLVWSRGFGEAKLEGKLPAAPETPYRLASLSKPFAAVLIMQLVEEGKLELDAPMRDFAIHPWFEPGGGSWAHYPSRYEERPITVRHVLTHTSEAEPPGEAYNYSGNIFADLTWVIEDVTKKSYPTVLQERIFGPLQMKRSLPGQLVPWGQAVAAEIATPYELRQGKAVAGSYPGFGLDPDVDVTPWSLDPAYRLPFATQAARVELLGKAYTPLYSSQAAAGMVSTVEDLARFDIALDADQLIAADTREQMFTPARNSAGKSLPYGLGWFVEDVDGKRLVWHYGWFPPTVSALYLKIPEENLTLLLLSNCDGLSAGMAWTAMGVRASPYARLFLHQFVGR
jgi:CubicO group peptidase (beta-lactamase class C family)